MQTRDNRVNEKGFVPPDSVHLARELKWYLMNDRDAHRYSITIQSNPIKKIAVIGGKRIIPWPDICLF